jgi:uncharacterized DUF497 family protein
MKLRFEWDEEKAKANFHKHKTASMKLQRFSATHFQSRCLTLTIQQMRNGI